MLILNGMSYDYPADSGYIDLAAGQANVMHTSALIVRILCAGLLLTGLSTLGLTCGLSGIASGWATAIAGEIGVRTTCHQPRFFVGMILCLIFAGVMGLYGLIVALSLRTAGGSSVDCRAPCYNPCFKDGYCHTV